MAKKKKANLSSDEAIRKAFGKVVSKGSELIERKRDKKTLSVSPAMDLALNGGLVEGSWTIVSGNPKTGKTTTCLQICKNAQDEDRPVIYVDGESRLKAYNLDGIKDLDLDRIEIIHSPEEGEALAAEDFLSIAESKLRDPENRGAVCIIDSCSSLIPRSELEDDVSASIRGSLPKLLSHWTKRNSQYITNNNIILVIITHYITNTSGYGKIKIPDCGVKIQYQADTRIDVKKIEPWDEAGTKIGQIIHWEVNCSSAGASGTGCESYLKYGKGIDKEKEVIELAESFGIIDKSGAWYSVPHLEGQDGFDEAPKFQGQAKLYDFLVENPAIYKDVEGQVKEMLASV